MKKAFVLLVSTFGWSLFTGIFVVSLALGGLFPVVNKISTPFVCRGGQMQVESQTLHPKPGETDIALTWWCVDNKTGAKQGINYFAIFLIAGTFYGLVLFFPAIVLVALWQMVYAARRPEMIKKKIDADLSPGIERLRLLRDTNKISQEQYESMVRSMQGKYQEILEKE